MQLAGSGLDRCQVTISTLQDSRHGIEGARLPHDLPLLFLTFDDKHRGNPNERGSRKLSRQFPELGFFECKHASLTDSFNNDYLPRASTVFWRHWRKITAWSSTAASNCTCLSVQSCNNPNWPLHMLWKWARMFWAACDHPSIIWSTEKW